MAALMQGKTMPEAMQWGSVNAAGVLGQIGPHAGLRTAKDIEMHLEQSKQYQVEVL
jgi:hypothetical protein